MKKAAVVHKKYLDIPAAVREFSKVAVYVGIPSDSPGNQRGGDEPSNAELAWIHEKGSESAGIPPRPFLFPGIAEQKRMISRQLERAMDAALHGKSKLAMTIMETLAIEAAGGVQDYLQDSSHFVPLAPATIANRWRSRHVREPVLEEKRYIRDSQGHRIKNPRFGEGVKPLINSASMLQSIIGIVKKD